MVGLDPLMCVQVYHNNCTCINYLFYDKNLISHSRDFFSERVILRLSVFSALLEPSGFSLCSTECRQQKKRHLSSDNKTGIYIWGNGAFDLFIYFCCCCCCISHASLCVGEVCVCVPVWYGELFLGIPNKDKEGGWIQAASVSGPQRHPAVAWRWRGRGDMKRNVCTCC